MAVGGVPDLADLSNVEENLQSQNDEIEVLQSIFEGDNDRVEILSRASINHAAPVEDLQNMLKITIPVICPDNVHIDVFQPADTDTNVPNGYPTSASVQIVRSESGRRIIWGFEATFLPPLCIHATLPKSYPSADPPSYAVSCIWMSPKQLTLVCQELDRLWTDNCGDDCSGMPILYTWIDWLQENILSMLGIVDQMSVTSHTVDEDVDDCRIVMETDDLNNIVTSLMRYNGEEEIRQFYKTDHECGVCFEENVGTKFFYLTECKHYMCRECLTSHCELLVKEGSVQHLICPMYECKAFIPPYILKEVLKPEDFDRYDSLSLQKALGSMGDVTWCPRCNSAVIIEPEEHLQLAHCTGCMYSFCTECMEKWHQGELCFTVQQEMEKEKQGEEKKYSDSEEKMRRLMQRKANRESNKYITDMAKRCPGCKAPIMKIGGCNKVVCGNCCSSICWVCMQKINGYEHFSKSPKCSTFDFTGETVDNTDIGERFINYGIPRPAPVKKPVVVTKGMEIRERLNIEPELQSLVRNCVSCKAINLAENKSNHIRCWNCKVNFCGHCQKKIIGPVGKHFSGTGSCPQHNV